MQSKDSSRQFVKVHAPWDVLTRIAELIPLKMPIKVCYLKLYLPFDSRCNLLWSVLSIKKTILICGH